MQSAMFVSEPRSDGRAVVQTGMYQAYAQLLEEVGQQLKQRQYSAHELYEILILLYGRSFLRFIGF